MLVGLKEKSNKWMIGVFLLLVALSRWPGLFPPSFSVVYALAFCAGLYFAKSMAWWLPLLILVATDVALNFYYQTKGYEVWTGAVIKYQLVNYLGYLGIIWLGRRFQPQAAAKKRAKLQAAGNFLSLVGGGILGALIFFLVTNTASWLLNPFQNPEYAKTFSGWLIAIVKGTNGWPQTWEFFRNTLLSGGLFTGLLVGAMKLSGAESPAEKEAGVRAEEPEGEAQPEEAGA
jgi:hypothetical protein